MPARRRDPRAEKDRDYAHGVHTPSSNGLRGHKPRRKAAIHRAERVRWTGLLAAGSGTPPEEVEERGRRAAPWRADINLAIPLATHAADTAAERLIARVDSFFHLPYDPARHRAPLVEALEKLTRPRKRRGSVVGAKLANELLADPIRPFHGYGGRLWRDEETRARRRAWFADFVDAEPEWARRLASWVELEHRALVLGA